MAKPLVSDELWEILQPLLPSPKPRRFRNPGRKPLDDRKALTGILFVRHSVRIAERPALGDAAPGAGRRFGDDLLASAAGLAARGSVAKAP